jgi:UDP-N-acetyl-D-mannosaminuronic acid transferase (WecB/TagA/CpsF family)
MLGNNTKERKLTVSQNKENTLNIQELTNSINSSIIQLNEKLEEESSKSENNLLKQLNLSRVQNEKEDNQKTSKSEIQEKKKLYLAFNKKERSLIDQAFKIVNLREQENRAGREFKKEVVREQVEKTKDIFFMGITKGLIEREQNKMKAEIEKGEQILKDFEQKILEDNCEFKEMFNKKKQMTDQLEKEANKISIKKNKIVEELKKKSKKKGNFN